MPNAAFKTKHGGINLNLATTGTTEVPGKAYVQIVTHHGRVNVNLVSLTRFRRHVHTNACLSSLLSKRTRTSVLKSSRSMHPSPSSSHQTSMVSSASQAGAATCSSSKSLPNVHVSSSQTTITQTCSSVPATSRRSSPQARAPTIALSRLATAG